MCLVLLLIINHFKMENLIRIKLLKPALMSQRCQKQQKMALYNHSHNLDFYIIQMRKTFNINNFLNEKPSHPSSRLLDNTALSNTKPQRLDYYQQYLQKNHGNHSNSNVGSDSSPFKRTTTMETADYTNKRNDNNTARYGEETPFRKDSDADSKDVKNLATQRIYYDRSQYNNSNKPSARNERQWEVELQLNINKLKDIKSYLEGEISSLQNLLDDTSRNIENIDLQFEKIKEKIMDYTSRSLDAAFRKYKSQMTRWSKYEAVEKKSLEIMIEMKEGIKEGENMLNVLREGTKIPGIENAMRQMSNKVQHYKFTTNEVKKVREECLNRHPTLRQEKIVEFERALEDLCRF